MAFETAEWSVIGIMTTIILGGGGVLVRALDRINKAQSTASEASATAETAESRVIQLEKELTDHRVAVARDYVSNETMVRMENRVLDAIKGLADRFDSFLKANH